MAAGGGVHHPSNEPSPRQNLLRPSSASRAQTPKAAYSQRLPASAGAACFESADCIGPALTSIFRGAQPSEGEPLLPRHIRTTPSPNLIRREDGQDEVAHDSNASLAERYEAEIAKLRQQLRAHTAARDAPRGNAPAETYLENEMNDEELAPTPTSSAPAREHEDDLLSKSLAASLANISIAKPPALLSDKTAEFIMSDLELYDRMPYRARLISQAARVDETVIDFVEGMPTGGAQEIAAYITLTGKECLDKRLGTAIIDSLNNKAEYVQLLIKATEKDPKLGTSGLHMLHWIATEGDDDDDDPESIKREFDAKAYFQQGAATKVNKLAGAQLSAAIKTLPSEYTAGKFAALKLILGKIPYNLQSSQWAKQLSIDLRLESKKTGKAPWTEDVLISHIASFLAMEGKPIALVARQDGGGGGAKTTPAKLVDNKTYTGTVGMWNVEKNFGFIKLDGGGDDAFVHKSDTVGGVPLTEGERVSFKLGISERGGNTGKIKAVGVARIEKAAPPPSTPPPPPAATAAVAITQTVEEDEGEAYEAPTMRIHVVR